MPDNGVDFLKVNGWLMRGAIREDDLGYIFGFKFGGDPHDDPNGNFWRVMNHFYDPIYNRSLTLSSTAQHAFLVGSGEAIDFKRAPDWALGTGDFFSQPNAPQNWRRNHFTVFDAREAMYRALTGQSSDGKPVAPTEDDRNKYWATTFRALGDVVHLVQDMGQPQHTRNDPHAGAALIGFGHKSVYELYIEARATGANFTTGNGLPVPIAGLRYDGYDIPAFSNFVSFFTTAPWDGTLNRKGLADYSNRGFFSAGKNADSTEYPYPAGFITGIQQLDVDWLNNQIQPGKAATLIGNVPDSVTGNTDSGVPLASVGLWDQYLETYTGKSSYTLTKKNYDAMADLLIPRAVAYSAGIINYFFRGKLDFVADTNNAGAYLIKNLGPEAMSGDFTLYYDAADGKRYPVPGDQPTKTWAGRTIAKNGQLGNLSFSVPANPAPEVPGRYMLVFNGDMAHLVQDMVQPQQTHNNLRQVQGRGA